MSGDHFDPPAIAPFSIDELPGALRKLAPHTVSPTWLFALFAELESPRRNDQLLLAARRHGQIVGIAWLQIRPGNVGVLQVHAIAENEPEQTAAALIDALVIEATAQGVHFFQAVLDADFGPEAAAVKQSGFQYAADLLYLVSSRESFPTSPTMSDLAFDQFTESEFDFERLKSLIKRIYRGSMDCPCVQEMRSMDDVLASYRATGKYDSSNWLFVCNAESDFGCLLLAVHPAAEGAASENPLSQLHWELLYMGVVPKARGRGFGIEITRHAQWMAGCGGAERLVLAVDAANEPAIRVYSAAGFETWDRRSVFLRTK